MAFGPASRTRRSSPTGPGDHAVSRDARSVQRSAQTRVRTAPIVRAEFQEACMSAGITVQDALELFMTRAEAFGWLDQLARLQHRQIGLDLDTEGEALKATG